MKKYVDVYLLPIPEANIAAYKKVAAKAGNLFLKHSAYATASVLLGSESRGLHLYHSLLRSL